MFSDVVTSSKTHTLHKCKTLPASLMTVDRQIARAKILSRTRRGRGMAL